MKLRCLAVGKHSRFFVGDICQVTWLDDEEKKIAFNNAEAKYIGGFKLSNAKNLLAGDSAFRVQMIPEPVTDNEIIVGQ